MPTVGIVEEIPEKKMLKIVAPLGVLVALIPPPILHPPRFSKYFGIENEKCNHLVPSPPSAAGNQGDRVPL